MGSIHIYDVAKFFLQKGGPIISMKLQKIVYYAQAWSLVLRGKALFPERILAWSYGPIIYELYEQHKHNFVVTYLKYGDPTRLHDDEKAFLEKIYAYYSKFSYSELSQMTHSEDPWITAYRNTMHEEGSSSVISLESMEEFYSKKIHPF